MLLRTALAKACAKVSLDAAGARVMYARPNTVYRLACKPVVARLRYAPGSAEWLARLTASVRVTAWLNALGFPAVRPVDAGQPVTADGYIVTFWGYVPEVETPWGGIGGLARLLRRFHGLPPPRHRAPAGQPGWARCAPMWAAAGG